MLGLTDLDWISIMFSINTFVEQTRLWSKTENSKFEGKNRDTCHKYTLSKPTYHPWSPLLMLSFSFCETIFWNTINTQRLRIRKSNSEKKNNYLSCIPKPGWKMSKTIFRDESSLQKRSGIHVLHHWKNLNFWASKSVKDPNPISQRKIWDPVNMYDGTFLRKVDSILSLTVFAKKSPSQMFHRVDIGYWTYNLPRFTFVIQACSS